MSSLIEFLVSRGAVGFLEMDAAVQRMRREGGRLTTSLLEEADVSPDEIIAHIAEFAGNAPVTDALLRTIDVDLIDTWSALRARRLGALPLRIHGPVLDVGVLEPLDELELGEIAEEYGCTVTQYAMLEFRFFELLNRFYDAPIEERFLRMAARHPLELDVVSEFPLSEVERERTRMASSERHAVETPAPVPAGRLTPPSMSDSRATPPAAGVVSTGEIDFVQDPMLSVPDPDDGLPRSAVVDAATTNTIAAGAGELLPQDVVERLQREHEAQQHEEPREPQESGSHEISVLEPLPSATWTLEQLTSHYGVTDDRDEALLATLGFMRRYFERRVLLRFGDDRAIGYLERGFRVGEGIRNFSIPIAPLSGLDAMRRGQNYFHGPPRTIGLAEFYEAMGEPLPPDVVVLPVTIGDQVVLLVVGDNATAPVDPQELPLTFVVLNRLALCLELLILKGRNKRDESTGAANDSARRARAVAKQMTGEFRIPSLATSERGLVELPTQDWDLPDELAPRAENSGSDIDLTSEPDSELQDRPPRSTITTGEIDQIVQQVTDDSGWFNIEEIGDLLRADDDEHEPRSPTDQGPVARAQSPKPFMPVDLDSNETRLKPLTGKHPTLQLLNDEHDDVVYGRPRRRRQDTAQNPITAGATPPRGDREQMHESVAGSGFERQTPDSGLNPVDLDEPRGSTDEYPPPRETDDAELAEQRSTALHEAVDEAEDGGTARLPAYSETLSGERSPLSADTLMLHVDEVEVDNLPTMDVSDSDIQIDDAGPDPEARTSEYVAAAPPPFTKSATKTPPDPPEAEPPEADGNDEAELNDGDEDHEPSALIELDSYTRVLAETSSEHSLDPDMAQLFSDDETGVDEALTRLLSRRAADLPWILSAFPGPLRCDRDDPEQAAQPVQRHGPLLRLCYERLPAYVEQLWLALEGEGAESRYYALRLIALLREPSLRPALIETLFDADNSVRRLALQIVFNQRAVQPTQVHAVVRGLMETVLVGDRHQREASLVALTKLRSPASIPTLIDTLEDPDSKLAERAHEGLKRLTFRDLPPRSAEWFDWYEANGGDSDLKWLADAMTSDSEERRELAARYIERNLTLVLNYHAGIAEKQRDRARKQLERHFGL